MEMQLRNGDYEWYSQNKRGLQGQRKKSQPFQTYAKRSEHIWYFHCMNENQVDNIIRRW